MKLQFKVFKSLRHYKREVWHLKNPELKSSMELSIQPSVINGPDQVLGQQRSPPPLHLWRLY